MPTRDARMFRTIPAVPAPPRPAPVALRPVSPPVAAMPPAPVRPPEEIATSEDEAPRAVRSTMAESRDALKREMRQVAGREAPVAPNNGQPSSTKMFVFMALGIVAGAVAAVVAVKFLLHL